MAKVEFKLPEDFLTKLSKLGDRTDEIIPKVLEAGGKVVADKVRSNLDAVIGSNTKEESRSTGELSSALGISPTLIDRDGNHNIKIGFSEPRRDGRSNALIANVLEYGRSGQPPKPFLKPAKSASKAGCIEAMKAAFEKEAEDV